MVATLIMYSTIHQHNQQHKCHLKINISLQTRLRRYCTSSSNLDLTMGRQYMLAEPPRGHIYKLQRIQKMAIRMFTSTTRRDDVNATVKELHWLTTRHQLSILHSRLLIENFSHRVVNGRMFSIQLPPVSIVLYSVISLNELEQRRVNLPNV